MERIEHRSFFRKHSTGAAKIEFHSVAVERGMSWEEAYNLWSQCKTTDEGFYLISSVINLDNFNFLDVNHNHNQFFTGTYDS